MGCRLAIPFLVCCLTATCSSGGPDSEGGSGKRPIVRRSEQPGLARTDLSPDVASEPLAPPLEPREAGPRDASPERTPEPSEPGMETGPMQDPATPESTEIEPEPREAPPVTPEEGGWRAPADTVGYVIALEEGRPVLRSGAGALLFDLSPQLVLRSTGRAAGEEANLRWSCVEDPGGGWRCAGTVETDTRRLEVVYSGGRTDPQIRAAVRVTYLRSTETLEEALQFTTGPTDRPWIVGRDQQTRALAGAIRVGEWTHKLMFFGTRETAFALDAGFQVQALRAEPVSDDRYRVTLELDHAENHPYPRYTDCWDKYASFQENEISRHDEWPRAAGEVAEHSFRIYLGNVSPLRLSRLPRGYRAALSFTDHADQSSAEKLAVLLYGASDANPATTGRGFIGRGLGFTKSVFSLASPRTYAPQLESQPYFDTLFPALGRVPSFDVASHSPSGFRDDPADPAVAGAFDRLRGLAAGGGRVRPLVWIDHQPTTNCEAIANQGAIPGSRWFILEQLVDAGFKFFWAVQDINTRGRLNLLRADAPAVRSPLLYRHRRLERAAGTDASLWLWKSVWTFSKRERFYKMFSGDALDTLVAEEGIHVGHSYLDTYRRKGSMAKKTHMVRHGGALETREEFEQVLAAMAERQGAGDLWVTGASALFEHLVQLPRISLDYLPDGRIRVGNETTDDLRDLTLYLPESGKERISVTVDGAPLSADHQRHVRGRRFFWLDLPAGASHNLEIQGADGQLAPVLRGVQVSTRFGG